MLFFLFFISQSSLNFHFKNTLSNLYFLHRGFLDVSQAEGTIGSNLNPACLHFGAKYEFSLFVSSGFKNELNLKLPFGIDSIGGTSIPKIYVPFKMQIVNKGGFDFTGTKFKIGIFDFGISYHNEEFFGSDFDIVYTENISLDIYSHDIFSKEDHPKIPNRVKIPFPLNIIGEGNLNLKGKGDMSFKVYPFSIGSSFGFGNIAVGAGLNFKRFKGKTNLFYDIIGDFQNLSLKVDTTVSDNLGNLWDVNINLSGPFKGKFFGDQINGEFSGNQLGLVLGTKIKLPFITFGCALNYNIPFTLSGSIVGTYYYIDGIDRFLIDTSKIVVDSVNRTISGTVAADSIKFYYSERKHEILKKDLKFPKLIGLGAGLNLSFIANINVAGYIDFPQSSYAFGRIYLMFASGFGMGPLNFNFGSVLFWRYLRYEDFLVFTPPTVTLGIGSSFNIRFISLYLGGGTIPFLGLLSGFEKIGGEGKKAINPLKSLGFNFGFRVKV
ncbi:MAG: hypothetical protein ABDH37_01960 [Candidatus Hydrothermales bacterium]